MRICNNKSGLMDCGGGCYVGGVCMSKCKCEDSLVVNEKIVKQLMDESGRNGEIIARCKDITEKMHELDEESANQTGE